ncbi:MAG TPA: hypothetical protein ENN80_09050 [Candidatus Hydrogenedentes bacterium]|nr:hypothetical protein [Candidatus Hydrogenedentota bacterium]
MSPEEINQEQQPLDQAEIDAEPRSALGEIWDFLRVRKKFWLAPIIISLLLLALLMILGTQAGVVSPFVYML